MEVLTSEQTPDEIFTQPLKRFTCGVSVSNLIPKGYISFHSTFVAFISSGMWYMMSLKNSIVKKVEINPREFVSGDLSSSKYSRNLQAKLYIQKIAA